MDFHSMANWAAAATLLLVGIWLARRWRRRFVIDAGLSWTSAVLPGNKIYLYNLSAEQIVVKQWCLYLVGARIGSLQRRRLAGASWSRDGLRIEPYGMHVLYFAEGTMLPANADWPLQSRLIIKLKICGGWTRWRPLYPAGTNGCS